MRTTEDGVRMFAEPVGEIEILHKQKHSTRDDKLSDGKPVALNTAGDIFDIRATLEIGDATHVGLDIGGNLVTYDVRQSRLNGAELKPIDGRVRFQVLVDRPLLEIVGNNGRVYITQRREKIGDLESVKAFARGGDAKLVQLEVIELQSIWNN